MHAMLLSFDDTMTSLIKSVTQDIKERSECLYNPNENSKNNYVGWDTNEANFCFDFFCNVEHV